MIDCFIPVRFLDIIDIILVAFLMFQVYMLIRGTTAVNIFVGIFSFYLLWVVVKAFNMHLLSSILGQVIGVGVIATIVVFQQEIRRFLLIVGSRYFKGKHFSISNLIPQNFKNNQRSRLNIPALQKAVQDMAQTKTGVLIAITHKSELKMYSETGEIINGLVSAELLKSIFFKNNPLHDGGVIITDNTIHAARCIFPVSDNPNLPAYFGLRHRAALGISEETDALVIVVSEENGRIAYAKSGMIKTKVTPEELKDLLQRDLNEKNHVF